MAYFDNAATTYPKPKEVYDFMDEYYRKIGGSAGRGLYSSSLSATSLIDDTRKKISDLLHCESKQVVFTNTATIALNMIIQGLIKKGCKKIYISPFEHNAVTRVLHEFEKLGNISVEVLTVNSEFQYDFERIRYQFDSVKPDLVIMTHASNVCGVISPIEDVFEIAKEYNAITVVDMAQTAGLIDCNAGLDTIDFAVFDGHKTLYAPTGIAGFVMKPDFDLPPILFGGTGYESANQNMPNSVPEKYEMGTINILGVAGLNAALKWLEENKKLLRKKEIENRIRLINILEEYDFIRIVGNYNQCQYVGIVSCLIDGISSDSAAPIFDRCKIDVRTGLQCAPTAHKFIGTFPAGTIRFSVSFFTDENDFNQLIEALDYIEEGLG